jgi:glucuronoarabinoxylan endo-1,4-beta-xylanase
MYELPKSSEVTLILYDVLGRKVSMLVNENRNVGVHEVRFDDSKLASGIYFYRLQ